MSATRDDLTLCEELNCDVRTLRRWRRLDGCPKNDDVGEWKLFALRNGLGRDPTKTKTQLQEDLLRRDIRLRDLKISREEGQTVTVDDMRHYVGSFAARLDQLLTQKLEVETPPRVQGKDIVSIRAELRLIHDEIREIYNARLAEWEPKQV